MSHDDEVMCPDPQCKAVMRIVRTGTRTFLLDETTATQSP